MNRRQQTVLQIRALQEFHATAFKRRPRRTGRIPRPVRPVAIASEYLRGITALVLAPSRAAVADHLLPQLEALMREGQQERGDHGFLLSVLTRKDSAATKARALVEKIAAQVADDLSPGQIASLAERIGRRVSDHQKAQFRRQIKAAVGVDPLMTEPQIAPRISQFVEENVSLIKTIPSKFFGEIEQRVIAGVRQGTRATELATEIAERYGVAENVATRIANDQVGKFFGELTRVRQTTLGITGYTWRGMLDNRERPDHAEREGEHYEWDDPPEDGHPGQAINCRCWAEPDLSGILEDLES